MDLSYLNYIVEAAECRSITKAAQNLFISQPYLSRVIKEVEEELKVLIFIRTRQGVVLTPLGEEFINHAKGILTDYKKLLTLSNKQSPTKNNFSVTTVRSSLVMEAFIKLTEEYKTKNKSLFNIRETESNMPIQDVHFLNADIGVIYKSLSAKDHILKELKRKNMGYKKICRFKSCIVVGINHPLLKRNKEIKIEDLYDYGLVGYGNDYLPYDSKLLNFDYYGNIIDVKKIKQNITVSDRASLHNILTHTDYFSLGTQASSNQEAMFNITSIPISTNSEKEHLEMWVIYQKDIPLTSIASRFIEILIENYEDKNL